VNEERSDIQENYRAEYQEISANHRLFINLRFITTAFTAAIQSALLTFYSQALQKPLPQGYTTMIPVIGITSMFAILFIEQRNIKLFRLMIQRGKELEFNLGLPNGQFSRFSQISPPKGLEKFVTHTWGIRFIYLIFLTMWVFLYALNLFDH